MNANKRFYFLAALSLTGLFISAYQTWEYFQVRVGTAGFEAFCKVGETFDCHAVSASRYAEVFSGFPIAGFAAGFFLAFFVILMFTKSHTWWADAWRFLLGMSIVGTVVSVVYLFIMVKLIGTYCMLCLGIDAINILSLILLLSMKPKQEDRAPALSFEKMRFLGATLFAGMAVALIVSKMSDPLAGESSQLASVVKAVTSRPEIVLTESDDYPSIGPKDAKVTIVKFSDFQCPACRKGAFSIQPVLKRYQGQVRFVFRNFPLDAECNPDMQRRMHPFACEAARYVLCASDQGKFEPLYQKVFQNQDDLSSPQLVTWSKNLGIDMEQLNTCLADPRTNTRITRDLEEGKKVGVASTPTFFVNGRRLAGAMPTVVWNEIVESFLKK